MIVDGDCDARQSAVSAPIPPSLGPVIKTESEIPALGGLLCREIRDQSYMFVP